MVFVKWWSLQEGGKPKIVGLHRSEVLVPRDLTSEIFGSCSMIPKLRSVLWYRFILFWPGYKDCWASSTSASCDVARCQKCAYPSADDASSQVATLKSFAAVAGLGLSSAWNERTFGGLEVQKLCCLLWLGLIGFQYMKHHVIVHEAYSNYSFSFFSFDQTV